MSTRRRQQKPPKTPIYIGCEGRSEQQYALLLQGMIRDGDLPVFLIVQEFGAGTGDPLSRIRSAISYLHEKARNREAPTHRFALLDHDQAEADPVSARNAQALADQHVIRIVWQRPCFEAVLLRHLPGCESRRPPDSQTALASLRSEWPGYNKAMPHRDLAKRIDRPALNRVAVVEPDLHDMLGRLRLVPQPSSDATGGRRRDTRKLG